MMNELDNKDVAIVQLLRKNARLSYSEIGEQVGLSRTAVKTRVTALENSGVIKGYKACIDPFANTTMMPFIVNIETKPEHFEDTKAFFAEAAETITVIQTTGGCHIMAICVAKDLPTMREYLNNIYKYRPGIVSIKANSVLEVIKGSIIPD